MANRDSLGVLKKGMIKIAEPRLIGDCAVAGGSVSDGPRARIVEQDESSTVIEVICTCGKSIYLKCDYAHAGETEGGDPATPDRQDEGKEQA